MFVTFQDRSRRESITSQRLPAGITATWITPERGQDGIRCSGFYDVKDRRGTICRWRGIRRVWSLHLCTGGETKGFQIGRVGFGSRLGGAASALPK